MRVGLVGLQHSLGGFHGHRLGELADFHLDIRARDGVGTDLGIGLHVRPETLGDHFQIVVARQHVDDRVASADIGGSLFGKPGFRTGDSYGSPRDNGVALIGDGADHRAVKHLRGGWTDVYSAKYGKTQY